MLSKTSITLVKLYNLVKSNATDKEKRLQDQLKKKVKMPYKMYAGIKKSVKQKYEKQQQIDKSVFFNKKRMK
jgi:hypothetical protein